MAFMERIVAGAVSGEHAADLVRDEHVIDAVGSEHVVVHLLRHHDAERDHRPDSLARFVALGQRLSLPPAGCVALASVFQLTEAVLGRRLVAGDGACLSADERAMLRLLGARLPTTATQGSADMPHGLPGALAWAVLSVRRLCGEIVPPDARRETGADAGCPFAAMEQSCI